jgi:biopolymer transport protein ExbD
MNAPFRFKTRHQPKAQIDITSLIDLVFLLVAFFMVTSSMGSLSSITVHLPKAVQSAPARSGEMVVSVNEKNEVYINDVKYDEGALREEFTKRKESLGENPVIIRGDRKADYEKIVKVMDLLNQAGIPKFTLSTVKSR